MITYISPTGNNCLIIHFPGTRTLRKRLLLRSWSYLPVTLPENLTVITTVDNGSLESSTLITQLENSNIPYINSALNKDAVEWDNTKKLQFLVDALNQVTTDYCLILDGTDVAILQDLSQVIDLYKSYNVQVLYNAGDCIFPAIDIEDVPDRENYGIFKYINAGCCIGTTTALKQIYTEALEEYNNNHDNLYATSELYYVRKVYANHTTDGLIGIDYQCKIFQVWHLLNDTVNIQNGRIVHTLSHPNATATTPTKELTKTVETDDI